MLLKPVQVVRFFLDRGIKPRSAHASQEPRDDCSAPG